MDSSSVLLQSRLCYVRASIFETRWKYLRETGWRLSRSTCKVELIPGELVSGPTTVRKRNSTWAESFEGDGSWNPSLSNGGASFASQIKLNWSSLKGLARGPVLVVSHSFRAASWLKLCHTEVNAPHIEWIAHLVFCKWAEKDVNTNTWSVMFFPTLGLSTTVVTPAASSSSLSPIHECKRMWGVPNTLLDKITSFSAMTLLDVPLALELTSATWKSMSFGPTGVTLVTCVLRSMCTLFPVWPKNAVAPLLRSEFESMVNWFQPVDENINISFSFKRHEK